MILQERDCVCVFGMPVATMPLQLLVRSSHCRVAFRFPPLGTLSRGGGMGG